MSTNPVTTNVRIGDLAKLNRESNRYAILVNAILVLFAFADFVLIALGLWLRSF